jgi:hypothetical protein
MGAWLPAAIRRPRAPLDSGQPWAGSHCPDGVARELAVGAL